MTDRKLEPLPHLATFQALMDHGGVTAAAGALGVTQSAVSKQLAKLREIYGDDLFVRTPKGMQPTPRALEMQPSVTAILSEAQTLLDAKRFDPYDLAGEITISTTDDVRFELVPGTLARLVEEAPQVRLTVIPLQRDYSVRLLETGAVDLVVSVNWHAPDTLKQSLLRSEPFVCLLGAEHPQAGKGFTIESYASATHVMVAPLGMRQGFIDVVLSQYRLRRFVRLSVPDFFQITPEILGDKHVATLPGRVAKYIAAQAPGPIGHSTASV